MNNFIFTCQGAFLGLNKENKQQVDAYTLFGLGGGGVKMAKSFC